MKYYIRVGDTIFSVSKKDYKEYYKALERWKYIKKRDRKKTVSLDQAIEEGTFELMISSFSASTEDEGIKNIQISLMLEEMSRLEERDREMIKLLYYDRLSIRETSELLGIGIASVVRGRDKILLRLKKFLRKPEK